MSREDFQVCNNCSKNSADYYDELGWVSIDEYSFSLSGRRQRTREANTLRYINQLQADGGGLDFCSIPCLLEYMFMKKGLFNRDHDDYGEFKQRQTEDVKDFYKKIEQLLLYAKGLF